MLEGVRSNNIDPASVIDEVLGNVTQDGIVKTGRIATAALGVQIAQGAGAIVAKQVKSTFEQLDAIKATMAEGDIGLVMFDDDEELRGRYAKEGGVLVWKEALTETQSAAAAALAKQYRDEALAVAPTFWEQIRDDAINGSAEEANRSRDEADRALEEADRSDLAAGLAIMAKSLAEAARDGSQLDANVYSTLAAGMLAVPDGKQFMVASVNEVIRYQKETTSTQTIKGRYPTSARAKDALIKATQPTSIYTRIPLTWQGTNQFIRYSDGAPASNANFQYAIVDVTPGEVLSFTNNWTGDQLALATWFDASNSYVGFELRGISGTPVSFVDSLLVVPDGVTKLAVSATLANQVNCQVKRGTQNLGLARDFSGLLNLFNLLSTSMRSSLTNLIAIPGDGLVPGNFVAYNTGLISANAGYNYQMYTVVPGDRVFASARINGSTTALAVFFDAGGAYQGYAVQAASGSAVPYVNYEIVVPPNVTKIALCQGISQNATAPLALKHYEVIPNIATRLSALETTVAALPRQLTIQNSDRLSFAGDSYSASGFTHRDKSYQAKVSLHSDWNIENFAVSGETYQKNLERLRNGTLTYGNVTLKNYGSTYLVAMSLVNDGSRSSLAEFQDDVRAFVETARGIGAIPVICSEWKEAYSNNGSNALRAVAEQMGALFWDIFSTARLFTAVQPARFYGQDHPGVRTNEVISEPVEELVRLLGRPRQSLKLFRKRASVAVAAIDDLLFDGHFDRARLFKEISLGHTALTAAKADWYDKLDDTANYATETVQSEYLKLQAGVAVAWADYGLVDAIVDATLENLSGVSLILSDPAVQVYVRDVLAAPYEAATQYQRFDVAAASGAVVGDTYTVAAPINGVSTFTVVGEWNGAVMMSPNARGNAGAGTLTKATGSGPATIAYTGYRSGFPAAYYTNFGKPEGHWVAVPGSGGVFPIAQADLRGKVQFDKLSFLLFKAGGFSLTNVRVDYLTAKTGKPSFPNRTQLRTRPARGTELLAQPLVGSSGNLAQWTLSEGAPASIAPEDAAPPRGVTGITRVSPTVKLGQQTNAFTAVDDEQREVEVRVWARRYPAIYEPGAGSPPITEDSFDWDRLVVSFARDTSVIPVKQKVGLHWKQVLFRTLIPVNQATMQLRIWAETGVIEVAKASVRFVD